MKHPWKELTRLTGSQPFVVERVRLESSGVAIEGRFELPRLALLPAEDLAFIEAFVANHGSIKEMERLFGISYPTVKNRLNRIIEAMGWEPVRVETAEADTDGRAALRSRTEILDRLARGEIDSAQAEKELRRCSRQR